jgi:hypothetical protein
MPQSIAIIAMPYKPAIDDSLAPVTAGRTAMARKIVSRYNGKLFQ